LSRIECSHQFGFVHGVGEYVESSGQCTDIEYCEFELEQRSDFGWHDEFDLQQRCAVQCVLALRDDDRGAVDYAPGTVPGYYGVIQPCSECCAWRGDQ